MMKRCLALVYSSQEKACLAAVLVFSTAGLEAKEMTLISGETYSAVEIMRTTTDSIVIKHKDGMATVRYHEITPRSIKDFALESKVAEADLSREQILETRITKQIQLMKSIDRPLQISESETVSAKKIADFDLNSIKLREGNSIRRVFALDMPESTAWLLGFDLDFIREMEGTKTATPEPEE